MLLQASVRCSSACLTPVAMHVPHDKLGADYISSHRVSLCVLSALT